MAEVGWHPDPAGQYQYRYWDGHGWTDAVSHHGQTYQVPLPPLQSTAAAASPATPVAAMAQPVDVANFADQHPVNDLSAQRDTEVASMFEVDILVMAQSDKHQFSFHDREENLLGLLGPDPGGSQRSPSTYMTTDPYGRPLVRVKKGMTSLVLESASQQLGSVGQANLTTLQKLRFNFIANYQTIGTMEGKSWSDDASLIILDLDGEKVGTVDKVRLSSDSIRQRLSTKHDRYLMKFENECDPHLRTLATYSALMLDVIRSNK